MGDVVELSEWPLAWPLEWPFMMEVVLGISRAGVVGLGVVDRTYGSE